MGKTLDQIEAEEAAKLAAEKAKVKTAKEKNSDTIAVLFDTELLTALALTVSDTPSVIASFTVAGVVWQIKPGYGPMYVYAQATGDAIEYPLTNNQAINRSKLMKAISEWRQRRAIP